MKTNNSSFSGSYIDRLVTEPIINNEAEVAVIFRDASVNDVLRHLILLRTLCCFDAVTTPSMYEALSFYLLNKSPWFNKKVLC